MKRGSSGAERQTTNTSIQSHSTFAGSGEPVHLREMRVAASGHARPMVSLAT
jgi:hypothetical protein